MSQCCDRPNHALSFRWWSENGDALHSRLEICICMELKIPELPFDKRFVRFDNSVADNGYPNSSSRWVDTTVWISYSYSYLGSWVGQLTAVADASLLIPGPGLYPRIVLLWLSRVGRIQNQWHNYPACLNSCPDWPGVGDFNFRLTISMLFGRVVYKSHGSLAEWIIGRHGSMSSYTTVIQVV